MIHKMFVNNYKLNIKDFSSGSTEQFVTVPISTQYQIVDNSELIDRVFVDIEVENSINKILNYDRVRYTPLTNNDNFISNITFDISVLDSNNNFVTSYGGAGFVDDDIKFKKNAFTKSFIKLSFYDSDNLMTQNLVAFSTIFSRLRTVDLLTSSNSSIAGLPKPVNDIPLNFTVNNPLTNYRAVSEGFYLYYYQDILKIGETKYLYMRASFNNAKNGKSINLMVKNTPQNIQNLVNELHTRIIITRTNDGYYYKFDDSYQGNLNVSPNNVIFVGDSVNIKLYQVFAL